MKNIGLKNLDVFHLAKGAEFKKDLLYFDKLLIDQDHYKLFTKIAHDLSNKSIQSDINYQINEIDYLENKGLIEIVDIRDYYKNLGGKQNLDLISIDVDFDELKKNFFNYKSEERVGKVFDLFSIHNVEANLNSRIFCSKLNELGNLDIKPIIEIRDTSKKFLPDLKETKINSFEKKINISNLILKKFPIPDNSVSWEEIISFKENSDLKVYRLGILNWISEIGNSNLTVYEIEQKLEYLIIRYEERLNLDKIKYHTGNAELIITSTLEVLENITKLKWSNAAKNLFDLRRKKVDLMIGETLAPGREVAYISKVQEQFG